MLMATSFEMVYEMVTSKDVADSPGSLLANPLARSVSQAPLRWLSILAAPGRPCRGRTPGTCVADDGWHMEPDQGLTNTDMLRDTTKVGSVRPSTFR